MVSNGELPPIKLPRWMDLNTIILVATALAGAYGNWAVMQDKLADYKVEIAQMNTHINATDSNLQELKYDFIESRAQLRDLIENLQRQHTQLERSIPPIPGGIQR